MKYFGGQRTSDTLIFAITCILSVGAQKQFTVLDGCVQDFSCRELSGRDISRTALPDPVDCSIYYRCNGVNLIQEECSQGDFFDAESGECVEMSLAICQPECSSGSGIRAVFLASVTGTGLATALAEPPTSTQESDQDPITSTTNPITSTQQVTKTTVPVGKSWETPPSLFSPCTDVFDCAVLSQFTTIPDPQNCQYYYQCIGGEIEHLSCPTGNNFDFLQGCAPSLLARCHPACQDGRGIITPSIDAKSTTGADESLTDAETVSLIVPSTKVITSPSAKSVLTTTKSTTITPRSTPPKTKTWETPPDLFNVCSDVFDCSVFEEFTTIPDPENCSSYYQCESGQIVQKNCLPNERYDSIAFQCFPFNFARCHSPCPDGGIKTPSVAPVTTSKPFIRTTAKATTKLVPTSRPVFISTEKMSSTIATSASPAPSTTRASTDSVTTSQPGVITSADLSSPVQSVPLSTVGRTSPMNTPPPSTIRPTGTLHSEPTLTTNASGSVQSDPQSSEVPISTMQSGHLTSEEATMTVQMRTQSTSDTLNSVLPDSLSSVRPPITEQPGLQTTHVLSTAMRNNMSEETSMLQSTSDEVVVATSVTTGSVTKSSMAVTKSDVTVEEMQSGATDYSDVTTISSFTDISTKTDSNYHHSSTFTEMTSSPSRSSSSTGILTTCDEEPVVCNDPDDVEFLPSSKNCSLYYTCVLGTLNLVTCKEGFLFDTITNSCQEAWNATCLTPCRDTSEPDLSTSTKSTDTSLQLSSFLADISSQEPTSSYSSDDLSICGVHPPCLNTTVSLRWPFHHKVCDRRYYECNLGVVNLEICGQTDMFSVDINDCKEAHLAVCRVLCTEPTTQYQSTVGIEQSSPHQSSTTSLPLTGNVDTTSEISQTSTILTSSIRTDNSDITNSYSTHTPVSSSFSENQFTSQTVSATSAVFETMSSITGDQTTSVLTHQSTLDQRIQSTEVPLIISTSLKEQETSKAASQSSNEPNFQTTSKPDIQTTAGSNLHTSSESDIQPSTRSNIPKTSEPNIITTTASNAETTSEPDIQSKAVTNIQTTSEPDIITTVGSKLQTTSEPDIQNTAGSNLQTTSGQDIRFSTRSYIQTTSVPDIQTPTGSNLHTTSEANVQTPTGSNLQTTSEANIQTTAESNLQTTSEANIQTSAGSKFQTTSEANIQTTARPKLQTTSEPDIQTTARSKLQTTSEPDIQTTARSNLQTTSQTDVQTTLGSNYQTSEPDVRSISMTNPQSTTNIDVHSSTLLTSPSSSTTKSPDTHTSFPSRISSTDYSSSATVNSNTSQPDLQTTLTSKYDLVSLTSVIDTSTAAQVSIASTTSYHTTEEMPYVNPCSPGDECERDGQLTAVPGRCDAYLVCAKKQWLQRTCTGDMTFDKDLLVCKENGTCMEDCFEHSLRVDASVINEGERVTFVCSFKPDVTWGPRLEGYQWALNGIGISGNIPGSRIEIYTTQTDVTGAWDSHLIFDPIYSDDKGLVRCEATHRYDVTDSRAAVSVRDVPAHVTPLPEVRIEPMTVSEPANKSVAIVCRGQPDVTHLTWYRNGVEIPYDDDVIVSPANQSTQTISVRVNANATYSCRAHNSAGDSRLADSEVTLIRSMREVCLNASQARIQWTKTVAGSTNRQFCPSPARGEATRRCVWDGDDVKWEEPNLNDCVDDEYTDLVHLIQRLEDGIGADNSSYIMETSDKVRNASSMGQGHIAPGNVNATVESLALLANLRDINENVTIETEEVQNIVTSVSNLLSEDYFSAWDSIKMDDEARPSSLMKSLEIYGKRSGQQLPLNGHQNIHASNAVLQSDHIPASAPVSVMYPRRLSEPDWLASTEDYIRIEKDTLQSIADQIPGDSFVLSSCYYRTINAILPTKGENSSVDSRVLALSLNGLRSDTMLDPPIVYALRREEVDDENMNLTCSFWNYTASESGDWSPNGCRMMSNVAGKTTCACDHLTNFAIIISPSPAIDGIHYTILSTISLIGCVISIVALVVTILIYASMWKHLKSHQAVVLLNLCVALIIANIIFVAGIDKTEPEVLCTVVAVLLHFFYLAAFFIMLVEGIELLLYIIYVFHVHRKRETAMLIVIAWFLPLTVVGITMGVTRLDGYGNENFCWLTMDRGLLWAFIGPVCFVILVNLIIFVIVLRRISTAKIPTDVNNGKKRNRVRASLWNIIVITPILGLTWLFGVFAINDDTVWLQYIFCVLNSLQGLFICIFHACCNKKVRDNMSSKSPSSSRSNFSIGRIIGQRNKSQNSSKDKYKVKTSAQSKRSRLKSDSSGKTSNNTLSVQSDKHNRADILASLSPNERQLYLRQLSGSNEVPYTMDCLGGNLSDVSSGYSSQSTYSAGDRTFNTFVPKEETSKEETNKEETNKEETNNEETNGDVGNGMTRRNSSLVDKTSNNHKPARILSSTSC